MTPDLRELEAAERAAFAELGRLGEALRRWEADTARVSAECGVDDAKAAEDEALDAVMELQALVAGTPARTLAGLIFKARYAAERDNDPDVMVSIVADLLALDGEA